MEYSFKKINKAQSIDKMKDDTISNINTINKLLEEVEKLKLGYFESNTEETTKIIKEENITTENIDESNSLNEEINYYYSRIKDLNITKNDESLKKIIKELPSKKNSNYQNIILENNLFLLNFDINDIKKIYILKNINLLPRDINEILNIINNKTFLTCIKDIDSYIFNIVNYRINPNIFNTQEIDQNKYFTFDDTNRTIEINGIILSKNRIKRNMLKLENTNLSDFDKKIYTLVHNSILTEEEYNNIIFGLQDTKKSLIK